jgi:hypothetical protein
MRVIIYKECSILSLLSKNKQTIKQQEVYVLLQSAIMNITPDRQGATLEQLN